MSCAACRNSAAPSTFGELRTQPPDDLVGRTVALIARLQGDEEAAVVLRLHAVGAETHADCGNGGILLDNLRERALQAC
jgi:hypothetical protein